MRKYVNIVGIGKRRSGTSKSGKPYDFTPISFTYEDKCVMIKLLEGILDAIASLIFIIPTLIDFLISGIMGIFTIIGKLPAYTAMLTSCFAAFPAYIQSAVACSISVVIVWMVIKKGPADG